jgi:hypothetical protein
LAQDDTPSDQSDTETPAKGAQETSQDRGIFLPLIFGGAVAAALGFFGSQIDSVERALGLAPPPEENGLQETVDAQAAELATLEERIAALTQTVDDLPEPPPPTDLSGLEDQLTQQSARIDEQAARLDQLAQRVEEVEKRPMTESVSEDAIAAYEEELQRLQSAVAEQQADLQATVAEQRAEIESLLAEAQASETAAERNARIATARAAAAKIIAAVDNGAPFATELAELQEAGGVEVPEILAETAETGVATLGDLQIRFPDVARDGLSAARKEEADAGQGGFGAFLDRQLGARSVTPQEGDDPDAVLSRAEAAVRQGRLGDALAEIDALPDSARAAMSTWISQAETRHDAVRAAQALMTALATN